VRVAQISDPSLAKVAARSGRELALQADLAKKATVSLRTVAAFERGEITPLPNYLSGDPS
jgi:DNA-binding XRE family transcriptional regulator